MNATLSVEPSITTCSSPRAIPRLEERAFDGPRSDADRVLAAADALLAQGEYLLQIVPLEAYRRRLPEAFHGSIGGHVRHCLEHFQSLAEGGLCAHVDYDRRAREVRLEMEPELALGRFRQLRDRLGQWRAPDLAVPATVRCEVSYAEGDSPVTQSTLGRELVYAIAHAIHHFALISVMARLQGVTLPAEFGVAPSTVAHQRSVVHCGRP